MHIRPPLLDRAAVVTSAIIQIVRNAVRARLAGKKPDLAEARAAIETLLRDEFADVTRTAINEIRLNDE